MSGFSCGSGPLAVGVTGAAAVPAEEARPLTATLRGFVEIAAIMDLRLHPEERARVTSQLQAIRTLGQARD